MIDCYQRRSRLCTKITIKQLDFNDKKKKRFSRTYSTRIPWLFATNFSTSQNIHRRFESVAFNRRIYWKVAFLFLETRIESWNLVGWSSNLVATYWITYLSSSLPWCVSFTFRVKLAPGQNVLERRSTIRRKCNFSSRLVSRRDYFSRASHAIYAATDNAYVCTYTLATVLQNFPEMYLPAIKSRVR